MAPCPRTPLVPPPCDRRTLNQLEPWWSLQQGEGLGSGAERAAAGAACPRHSGDIQDLRCPWHSWRAGGSSTKEGKAPRSSAGFGHIGALLHPQLPQPGPPLVSVARPWHGTTVVAVVVGAGGGGAPQGSPQPSQNARLGVPSHLSTRHAWEQTGCTKSIPQYHQPGQGWGQTRSCSWDGRPLPAPMYPTSGSSPPTQTRSLWTCWDLGAQGAPGKPPCSSHTSPEHRLILGSLLSTEKACTSRSRRALETSTGQNQGAPTTLLHPDMGATTHLPQYNQDRKSTRLNSSH